MAQRCIPMWLMAWRLAAPGRSFRLLITTAAGVLSVILEWGTSVLMAGVGGHRPVGGRPTVVVSLAGERGPAAFEMVSSHPDLGVCLVVGAVGSPAPRVVSHSSPRQGRRRITKRPLFLGCRSIFCVNMVLSTGEGVYILALRGLSASNRLLGLSA